MRAGVAEDEGLLHRERSRGGKERGGGGGLSTAVGWGEERKWCRIIFTDTMREN
jgi:hypothetical protein